MSRERDLHRRAKPVNKQIIEYKLSELYAKVDMIVSLQISIGQLISTQGNLVKTVAPDIEIQSDPPLIKYVIDHMANIDECYLDLESVIGIKPQHDDINTSTGLINLQAAHILRNRFTEYESEQKLIIDKIPKESLESIKVGERTFKTLAEYIIYELPNITTIILESPIDTYPTQKFFIELLKTINKTDLILDATPIPPKIFKEICNNLPNRAIDLGITTLLITDEQLYQTIDPLHQTTEIWYNNITDLRIIGTPHNFRAPSQTKQYNLTIGTLTLDTTDSMDIDINILSQIEFINIIYTISIDDYRIPDKDKKLLMHVYKQKYEQHHILNLTNNTGYILNLKDYISQNIIDNVIVIKYLDIAEDIIHLDQQQVQIVNKAGDTIIDIPKNTKLLLNNNYFDETVYKPIKNSKNMAWIKNSAKDIGYEKLI